LGKGIRSFKKSMDSDEPVQPTENEAREGIKEKADPK
jgi:hypothetical protein